MPALSSKRFSGSPRLPSLQLTILAGFLAVLWLAGGASRPDVFGQAVVRGVSWLVVIAMIFASPRSGARRVQPVALLLTLSILLLVVQLIPLPPALWQALPGRAILTESMSLSGQQQPWRPWSMVPSATLNALASLVVPLATWLICASLGDQDCKRLPGLLLCFAVASMIAGLLQFSGAIINNPFVNASPGEVSGTFANRNHFALLMSIGCLLAPAWGLQGERPSPWRLPIVAGLILLFFLTILASGSRAGLGLGVIALMLSLVLSSRKLRKVLVRFPRGAYPAFVVAIIAMIAIFVLISVMADRAVSIDRLFVVDQGQDMRTRGLPTVWAMVQTFFPFGYGSGGFDPMFRMSEPFSFLTPSYFNHAHNDFLEVLLDSGLLGLLLLIGAIAWWGRASVRVWRLGSGRGNEVPKLGSAVVALVMVASLFDYPARTPIIMALLVIAGVCLSRHAEERVGLALPGRYEHL